MLQVNNAKHQKKRAAPADPSTSHAVLLLEQSEPLKPSLPLVSAISWEERSINLRHMDGDQE